MRILIAEDDLVSRRLLEGTLAGWGHEVVSCQDGDDAWQKLQQPDAPPLAVLDWMMPGIDGADLCRRIRAMLASSPYIILLTTRSDRTDVVEGFDAGADDFMRKPFDRDELRARVSAGVRIIELQHMLRERVAQLEAALANVKHLEGLLPICCYCKKIRNDGNYWQAVESYVSERTDAQFSHGICPECYERAIVGWK